MESHISYLWRFLSSTFQRYFFDIEYIVNYFNYITKFFSNKYLWRQNKKWVFKFFRNRKVYSSKIFLELSWCYISIKKERISKCARSLYINNYNYKVPSKYNKCLQFNLKTNILWTFTHILRLRHLDNTNIKRVILHELN